jgi:hypothetical protein
VAIASARTTLPWRLWCAQRRGTLKPNQNRTFNINNVNKRLPNLLDWLQAAKPDLVCLQELKTADKKL